VEETLEVHIEKGMRDNEKIVSLTFLTYLIILFKVFNGKGNQEPGLEPGDIVIVLDEQDHDVFTRRGNNLFMLMKLNITESLCGCKKSIKTLDGRTIVFQLLPGLFITHINLLDNFRRSHQARR
jgi:DnaJ-class molecular chaperone